MGLVELLHQPVHGRFKVRSPKELADAINSLAKQYTGWIVSSSASPPDLGEYDIKTTFKGNLPEDTAFIYSVRHFIYYSDDRADHLKGWAENFQFFEGDSRVELNIERCGLVDFLLAPWSGELKVSNLPAQGYRKQSRRLKRVAHRKLRAARTLIKETMPDLFKLARTPPGYNGAHSPMGFYGNTSWLESLR